MRVLDDPDLLETVSGLADLHKDSASVDVWDYPDDVDESDVDWEPSIDRSHSRWLCLSREPIRFLVWNKLSFFPTFGLQLLRTLSKKKKLGYWFASKLFSLFGKKSKWIWFPQFGLDTLYSTSKGRRRQRRRRRRRRRRSEGGNEK